MGVHFHTVLRDQSRRSIKTLLLRFVPLEQVPCLFEVQNIVVNREFVFAGVLRDVVDVANGMAFGSEGAYKKVNVYHGCNV